MTFDREPDLDNANVGIPEQKGKTESYQIGGFLFYVIGNSYGIPLLHKKALRAGSHCGGVVVCRLGDPPQAENPAKQDSFLLRLLRKIMGQEKKAW